MIPQQVKEKIREIAAKERRSLGSQALLLIELGLKEYQGTFDSLQARELAEALQGRQA